jgi:peptidoglycan/xylan/chitin deacetylase (PgdA/CDA1 family)
MRSAAKSMVERLLLASGAAAAGRARLRGRALVLAYHNIVPRGERPAGERSLHLPQSRFAEQLDLLLETHDIVPLDAAIEGDSPARRPRVAITFDDAYAGAVAAGGEELARRGLPATVFVAPGLLDGRDFWWDRYADPATGEVPAGFRRAALTEHRGADEAVDRYAAGSGLRPAALPEHATGATSAALRALAARPGITLGAHSWSHPNLAALGNDELEDELVRTLDWLRSRFPDRWIPVLAYPYGLHSPEAGAAVERAGYAGAFRVDGGWGERGDPPFFRPRFNVPSGLGARGFAVRAAGMFCG